MLALLSGIVSNSGIMAGHHWVIGKASLLTLSTIVHGPSAVMVEVLWSHKSAGFDVDET